MLFNCKRLTFCPLLFYGDTILLKNVSIVQMQVTHLPQDLDHQRSKVHVLIINNLGNAGQAHKG